MPIRVFAHPRGNVTTWHYDGNGLNVLNLQVSGKKHWQQERESGKPFCVKSWNG